MPVQPRLRRRYAADPVRSSPCSARRGACAWLRVALVLAPRRLSGHEARPSRCSSAIWLMQKGNIDMTHLSNGTVATDVDAHDDTAALSAQGYTIRHIETYHRDTDMSCIVWDAPAITEADLPF